MAYTNFSIQKINHALRDSLQLTTDEFCILLHAYDYCKKKKHKKLHCSREYFEHVANNLYYFPKTTVAILRSLISKGFFVRTKERNIFIRAESSILPFQPSMARFEELWELLKRNGNKQMAIEAYEKVTREVKHEYLIERAEAYLEHLDITDNQQLHVSTWLNPKNKRFDDQYKSKNNPKKNLASGNFFE